MTRQGRRLVRVRLKDRIKSSWKYPAKIVRAFGGFRGFSGFIVGGHALHVW